MIATLHIVRYPAFLGWAGFLSMAIFRLPLWLNRKIAFYKLMGCGKNGSFDKTPDLRQWALLLAAENGNLQTPKIITYWWRFFGCEIWELELEPIEGHGTWDQKAVFGNLPKQTSYEGPICVLTRATIRFSQLGRFWSHVDAIANQMSGAKGFITSIGIGEVPWVKQATFSIWESKGAMKDFAYKMQEHAAVIKKTYQEKWYSEDMFVRFRPLKSTGTLKGTLPFEINL